tara:strand:+ start:54 stop:1127 length:1074 start_codon:yes stop_codon:yes gene_type:complete
MSRDLNEKIIECLKQLSIKELPDFKITSEMISGINIKDGNIQFLLEFNENYKNHSKIICKAAELKVSYLDGVNSVTAIPTSHKNLEIKKSTDEKKINGIDKIIAVASGKGGVGKSTTSINIAISIKNLGYNVGILDADIYGPSLPKLIGNYDKPQSDGKQLIPIKAYGLQVMSIGFLVAEESPTIWRGPMVINALTQLLTQVAWKDLDYLIIDLPPGTGDIQLSLSQKANLNGSVIVSTPQDLALIDARKGLNMFRKVDVPVLGIIENMSYFICPSCNKQTNIFGHGGAMKEAEKLGIDFLGSIPLDTEIRKTSDEGKPITEISKSCKQSIQYQKIAEKVLSKVNVQEKSPPKIIFE